MSVEVSLLVRLWVEMIWNEWFRDENLRQPPCEAVSWNLMVLWILHLLLWSASLWGCELKLVDIDDGNVEFGQPPCEAVSWNVNADNLLVEADVSLLVRLWVEISAEKRWFTGWMVSLLVRLWVEIFSEYCEKSGVRSASLWGCELKLLGYIPSDPRYTVSLLVRLWVEIRFIGGQ